jgi:hypothetical protein
MIRSYKFIDTEHAKLHGFVMAFFCRIEHETRAFSNTFYAVEFLPVVKRHRKVLKQRFEFIYNNIPQPTRAEVCRRIIESNEIESICKGEITPLKTDDLTISNDIKTVLQDLFDDLYGQVLKGDIYTQECKIEQNHFELFRRANSHITKCPFCGIQELNDTFADPYDHYLAKSIYPFSSINFKNLLPTCSDCNGLHVKADKDIILLAQNGHLFYPFDTTYNGLRIDFSIDIDAADIENIEWKVNYVCDDGKADEIASWKAIYNIESRHLGFIKGRVKKWFTIYWEQKKSTWFSAFSEDDKHLAVMDMLEKDVEADLHYFRKPVLESYVSHYSRRAEVEARAATKLLSYL